MDFLHRFMDAAIVIRHLDVIACVIDHRWLGKKRRLHNSRCDIVSFSGAATWSIRLKNRAAEIVTPPQFCARLHHEH
jgi:hypothetical protein